MNHLKTERLRAQKKLERDLSALSLDAARRLMTLRAASPVLLLAGGVAARPHPSGLYWRAVSGWFSPELPQELRELCGGNPDRLLHPPGASWAAWASGRQTPRAAQYSGAAELLHTLSRSPAERPLHDRGASAFSAVERGLRLRPVAGPEMPEADLMAAQAYWDEHEWLRTGLWLGPGGPVHPDGQRLADPALLSRALGSTWTEDWRWNWSHPHDRRVEPGHTVLLRAYGLTRVGGWAPPPEPATPPRPSPAPTTPEMRPSIQIKPAELPAPQVPRPSGEVDRGDWHPSRAAGAARPTPVGTQDQSGLTGLARRLMIKAQMTPRPSPLDLPPLDLPPLDLPPLDLPSTPERQ